jgi:hypothetical protein
MIVVCHVLVVSRMRAAGYRKGVLCSGACTSLQRRIILVISNGNVHADGSSATGVILEVNWV